MRATFVARAGGLALLLSSGLLCCRRGSDYASLEQRAVQRDETKIERACDRIRGLGNELYVSLCDKDARQSVRSYNALRAVLEALPDPEKSEYASRTEKYERPIQLLGKALGTMSLAHKLMRESKQEELSAIDQTALQALQDEVFAGLSEEEANGLKKIGSGMQFYLQNPGKNLTRQNPYAGEN